MALFKKKNNKEEKKAPAYACNYGCPTPDTAETANSIYMEGQHGICSIKVLGTGCASCHALYENTKKAVQKLGAAVEITYVTDLQKVMEYGVMSMPALVVNEKAVSTGKVLKPADIEKLLHKLGF